MFSAKIVSIYRLRLILCFTYIHTHLHINEGSGGAQGKSKRDRDRDIDSSRADLYASIPHFYFVGCHLAKIFHICHLQSSAPSSFALPGRRIERERPIPEPEERVSESESAGYGRSLPRNYAICYSRFEAIVTVNHEDEGEEEGAAPLGDDLKCDFNSGIFDSPGVCTLSPLISRPHHLSTSTKLGLGHGYRMPIQSRREPRVQGGGEARAIACACGQPDGRRTTSWPESRTNGQHWFARIC